MTCDRCGAAIPPVWPDTPASNMMNGLRIAFSGGYAEFLDTAEAIGERDVKLAFCHDCGHWLMEQGPPFDRALAGHVGSTVCDRAGAAPA